MSFRGFPIPSLTDQWSTHMLQLDFKWPPSNTHWPWQDCIIQIWRWKSPLIHQNNILCSNLFVDLIPLMIFSLWLAFHQGIIAVEGMYVGCSISAVYWHDGSKLSASVSERMPRMTTAADEKSEVITRKKRKGHGKQNFEEDFHIFQKANWTALTITFNLIALMYLTE